MKAVILCAGKGERLRPLTENIPKPMILINGRPVLEYLIQLCKNNDIKEIAINTSYLPEKIKEYFGDGSKFGVKINYSFESELLGTSGALNNFRDFLDEPFFVIYGDNVTDLNLKKMLKEHQKNKAFATLYLYKEKMANEKTTPGRVIINESGEIKEIIENPNEEQKVKINSITENLKYSNSGIYILDNKILKFIPTGYSDFPKQIFQAILKADLKIYGYREDCYIREVGQMHRYLKAKEEIESNEFLKDFF